MIMSPLNANQPHECWGSTSATGGESPSLNIVQIYLKKSRMKPCCCMLQGKDLSFQWWVWQHSHCLTHSNPKMPINSL